MVEKTYSMGLYGLEAFPVEVEADLSQGLPAFELVGLPDAAVKESRDRVRAAVKNCGFEFPVSRITVNLAPADIKKEGPIYDLPLFLGLCCKASRQLALPHRRTRVFLGELSLLRGAAARPRRAAHGGSRPGKRGFKQAVCARGQRRRRAPSSRGLRCIGIRRRAPAGGPSATAMLELSPADPSYGGAGRASGTCWTFADVKGQARGQARHGNRRSRLPQRAAHRAAGLGQEHAGQAPAHHPAGDDLRGSLGDHQDTLHRGRRCPPGRLCCAPGPSARPTTPSPPRGWRAAGRSPQPGEISLAHNGVLFLDELPEFARPAMEVLRQPLGGRQGDHLPGGRHTSYPSRVYAGCRHEPLPLRLLSGTPPIPAPCHPHAVEPAIMGKVSGPLLDRIDLHIEVDPVAYSELASTQTRGELRPDSRAGQRRPETPAAALRGQGLRLQRRRHPRLPAAGDVPDHRGRRPPAPAGL